MSDLISRSEVLKLMDNIGHANYKDSDFYCLRKRILEIHSFDIDEVIAELEKEKLDYQNDSIISKISRLNIDNAIGIIKNHL